jgi:hypothetical protein
MRTTRSLSTLALSTLTLALAGCGLSESAAKQKLEEDGLKGVELTKEKEGFSFKGKDATGATCTGTITGTSSPGSSSYQVFKSCVSK